MAAVVAAAAGRAPTRITGDGRQTRDFVYVDDVVDALVRAGERGSGLVVNVGTGVQTSLRDLWALVAPKADRRPRRPGRPDELAALRRVAGAGPHPPRLVAVDDAGRGPRRPALTECWLISARTARGRRGEGGRARVAATAGSHDRRDDDGAHARGLDSRGERRVHGIDDQHAATGA